MVYVIVMIMNNIRIMTGCAFGFLWCFRCWNLFVGVCVLLLLACLLAWFLVCLLACLFVSWFVQWSVHVCDPHPERSEPKWLDRPRRFGVCLLLDFYRGISQTHKLRNPVIMEHETLQIQPERLETPLFASAALPLSTSTLCNGYIFMLGLELPSGLELSMSGFGTSCHHHKPKPLGFRYQRLLVLRYSHTEVFRVRV